MIFEFCLAAAAAAAAVEAAAANDVVNVIDNQFRIVAMKPKAEKPSD